MITVHGIKQCDTCRKALKWLAEEKISHRFHDLRLDGLDMRLLGEWMNSPFAGVLVNRRSTTWRSLTNAERGRTGQALLDLLLDRPTLIKRPVFTNGSILAVGFSRESREILRQQETARV